LTITIGHAYWYLRDIRDLRPLANRVGLFLAEITPAQANNLVLAFARALRQN